MLSNFGIVFSCFDIHAFVPRIDIVFFDKINRFALCCLPTQDNKNELKNDRVAKVLELSRV